jgi:hypothetical protein
LRWSFGGGTGRIGRSESGHDDDNDEAWDDEGSMGMKEKEVGVVSDCNSLLHNRGDAWSSPYLSMIALECLCG